MNELNSQMETAEEKISEHDDRSIEMIQDEEHTHTTFFKNKRIVSVTYMIRLNRPAYL